MPRRPIRKLVLLLFEIALILILLAVFLSPPRQPIAVIHIVDSTGHPVAGATLAARGLRTGGSYSADWYPWDISEHPAPKPLARTDSRGVARLRYPIYVFERLQTRVIIFSVNHPDFVTQEVELPVSPSALPSGVSLSVWLDFLKERLFQRNRASPPPPIVLAKGATLRISAVPNASMPPGALRVLLGDVEASDSSFWTNPAPEIVLTHSLAAGSHTFQAVQLAPNGACWFSDVKSISTVVGQSNDFPLALHPGLVFTGRLDDSVPRPVDHGRAIINIAPAGVGLSNRPPQWHAWASIRTDGSFTFSNLPPGDLEVVALCDGFVSTNGPGKFHFHYPQKFNLAADLSAVIGMERTAALQVRVLDSHEKPLPGATVALWPNVRYGDWAALSLGSDCYNTADTLSPDSPTPRLWNSIYTARTDSSGTAIVPNLPAEADVFNVEHPQWILPPRPTGWPGQQRRDQSIALIRGQTNLISVKLEPRNHSMISQY